MNIEEVGHIFDGIAKGLGTGLKDKEKRELAALSAMFRGFRNQGVSDFIRFVELSVNKETNSIPALVSRIKATKEGVGEPRQSLEKSLASVSAADLKKILTALNERPAAKKDDNLRLLRSVLSDKNDGVPADQGTVVDSNEAVNAAYLQYESIKADLRTITVDELRSRFARLSVLPKGVLGGLLAKLGYPSVDSKEQIEAVLLDNLTSIKMSYDQTNAIGS